MSPAANIKATKGITAVCRGQGTFHGAPSHHGDGQRLQGAPPGPPLAGAGPSCPCDRAGLVQQDLALSPVPATVTAPQPGCGHASSLLALSDLGFGALEEQLSLKSLMFKGRFGLFHLLLSPVISSTSCLVIHAMECWI